MKRNWARVLRRKGWLIVSLPLLVAGLFFALVDHFFGEYLAMLTEAQNLEYRASQVEQMKMYQPRLREIHELLKPQYQEIEARSFKAPSSAESIVQMESSVKNLLQGLYFDEIEVKPVAVSTGAKEADSLLFLEVDFVGVPQQLNRLESMLAVNKYALRVNQLNIMTEDNSVTGYGYIRIKSQFLALHIQPIIYSQIVNKSASR